jgi:hypothetical protein
MLWILIVLTSPAAAQMGAYDFCTGYLGNSQQFISTPHIQRHTELCVRRLVSVGCVATILMLVVPTFIQLSIRRGTVSKESHGDPENSNIRAVGAFLNSPRRFQLPTTDPNDTACKSCKHRVT